MSEMETRVPFSVFRASVEILLFIMGLLLVVFAFYAFSFGESNAGYEFSIDNAKSVALGLSQLRIRSVVAVASCIIGLVLLVRFAWMQIKLKNR